MKTLKSKIVMLAVLMVGVVAMSFTMIDKNSEVADTEMLHWFDPVGTNPGFIQSNTIDDEEAESDGCERDFQGCERGYTSSQLNNPSAPTSGVKSEEVNSPVATLGLP